MSQEGNRAIADESGGQQRQLQISQEEKKIFYSNKAYLILVHCVILIVITLKIIQW